MVAVVAYEDALQAKAVALLGRVYPTLPAASSPLATEAKRWAALDAGDLVGYAALWPMHPPKFRIDVVVAPVQRRRGVGSDLFARVLAAATEEQARTIQARPDAADEASVGFLGRRGFVETMRMQHLELVLAQARHAEHRDVFDRLSRDDVKIVTLADFLARSRGSDGRGDGDGDRGRGLDAYIDLVIAAREGWPDPDPDRPGDPPTVMDWGAMVRARQAEDAHVIVAEQRGRLIGFTGGLGTGVRPECRGRGVGTALKVAAIDAAIGRGETMMKTATGRDAMLHINKKLGFRETTCEVRMVRRLR